MLSGKHHHNIAMQHSKSLRSFSSESTAPILEQRPRSRSSLDTFVIPGRTRIPSNKPQPIDIQIAEALLDPKLALPKRNSPNTMMSIEHKKDREAKRLLETLGIQDTTCRKSSGEQPLGERKHQQSSAKPSEHKTDSIFTLKPHTQSISNIRPGISQRPPPRMGDCNVIVVPPRRSRKIGANPPSKRAGPTLPSKVTPPREQRRGFYDGAIGSSHGSRTTSMTWSTVSHRIFSSSTAHLQGSEAFASLEEFNRLAVQHGLPELENCPGGESLLG